MLIFIIVLIVFGHNRIPQLGEALGKGIKNFKVFRKDEQPTQGQQVQTRRSRKASPPKMSRR